MSNNDKEASSADSDLHGVDQHAGETEGYLLRELLPRHGHLKAVAKVNVDDLPTHSVQH